MWICVSFKPEVQGSLDPLKAWQMGLKIPFQATDQAPAAHVPESQNTEAKVGNWSPPNLGFSNPEHGHAINIYTLWQSNMAIENKLFM